MPTVKCDPRLESMCLVSCDMCSFNVISRLTPPSKPARRVIACVFEIHGYGMTLQNKDSGVLTNFTSYSLCNLVSV